MRSGPGLLVAALACAPVAPAAPALGQDADRPGHRLALYAILSTRLESNIDHDQPPIEDLGFIGGARATYDYETDDTAVSLSYEIGRHRYRVTDRWDRIGHNVKAGLERDLGGRWDLDVDGEASFGGSTEDRELADVFSIKPRLAFELDRRLELRLTGALRYKRIDADPARNATNPYAMLEIRRRLVAGATFTLGSRYEIKYTPSENSRYRRWTHAGELATPTWNGGRLQVEVRYRMKSYTRRWVDIEDGGEELRHDRRIIPQLSWTQPLQDRLELRLDYEFESRVSNDLEKEYQAHAVGLGLIVRVF